jgi:uncharacterized protein YllA (UPF0747 family)
LRVSDFRKCAAKKMEVSSLSMIIDVFDLDEDKVRADTADAMRAAGIPPALIYAYEETGLLVTQENRRLIPDVELREYDAKVREYKDLHADHEPNTG